MLGSDCAVLVNPRTKTQAINSFVLNLICHPSFLCSERLFLFDAVRASVPNGPPASPTASRLLARVSHSGPDLLCDLIQVPALGALKGRELFVALELLEPQRLADGQHVPVVDISRNRPGERTRVAETRLLPCA